MNYLNKMMTTRPDLIVQLLRPEPLPTLVFRPTDVEPHDQDADEQAPELTTEEN